LGQGGEGDLAVPAEVGAAFEVIQAEAVFEFAVLVVAELSRLGRSLDDLLALVGGLRERGIGIRSLHEALDTTTPGGRLIFHMFCRARRVHPRTDAGRHSRGHRSRASSRTTPWPPASPLPEQVERARYLLTRPENTIASMPGCSVLASR
jgi:hypothetical protein